MGTRIRVREGDLVWAADVGGSAVTLGGVAEAFQVREWAPGLWRVGHAIQGIASPEASLEGCAAAEGDVVWVAVGGELFEVHVDRSGDAARAPGRGHEALAAPMPATVVRVVAAPGMRVSMGDALVVLEAMKMELPIRAPRDGVVSAVHCREGDLVQPGVVLVDLE
jgi:3-methylcrotonyl-CoA carboxylase alpha subunit